MASSVKQDRDFKSVVMDNLPDDLLQQAIDFINQHLQPDDVFDDKKLESWAKDNDYKK